MSEFCGFIDLEKEPEKQIELNVENLEGNFSRRQNVDNSIPTDSDSLFFNLYQ